MFAPQTVDAETRRAIEKAIRNAERYGGQTSEVASKFRADAELRRRRKAEKRLRHVTGV